MWFKREQKNRRSGRSHVLDVKLRSAQVRSTRLRLLLLSSTLITSTVLSIYILWRVGEATLNVLVYENSDFAIQRVDVQTDGIIAPNALCRWSGVKLGENIVALDLAAVKRNLELVPAIRSVSVERILPHTLKIRVWERNSIAQVDVPHVGGAKGIAVSVFQLDADGVVMQALNPLVCNVPLARARDQLPVIAGLSIHQLQPGHRVDLPQALAALQLISAFGHSPMAGLVNLRSLDVSAPGVIVVTTGQGGKITFGLQNLDQQLRRWREIYDLGRRNNLAIASADLAVANNVPVRWMAVEVPPAVPPKDSTSAYTRRKNV